MFSLLNMHWIYNFILDQTSLPVLLIKRCNLLKRKGLDFKLNLYLKFKKIKKNFGKNLPKLPSDGGPKNTKIEVTGCSYRVVNVK